MDSSDVQQAGPSGSSEIAPEVTGKRTRKVYTKDANWTIETRLGELFHGAPFNNTNISFY